MSLDGPNRCCVPLVKSCKREGIYNRVDHFIHQISGNGLNLKKRGGCVCRLEKFQVGDQAEFLRGTRAESQWQGTGLCEWHRL